MIGGMPINEVIGYIHQAGALGVLAFLVALLLTGRIFTKGYVERQEQIIKEKNDEIVYLRDLIGRR